MKLKSLVAVAAFLAAGAASAATTLNLSSGAVTFSSSAALETYTFTLPTPVTDAEGTLTATLTPKAGYDITSVKFSSDGVTWTSLVDESIGSPDRFDNYTLFSGSLAAGTYYFTIAGVSKANGRYEGSLSVTPVPEPESLALAVAGLGVAGFVARRRKSA